MSHPWHGSFEFLQGAEQSLCVSREADRNSYNRFLAIAARAVRRSLKEEKRVIAERRGEMELRFTRWEVR